MSALKAVYFAWVRERIGHSEEVVELPGSVVTAGDLIAWLSARDERSAYAFENPATIRVAIDHTHAKHDAPLSGASEVAFFPPMTGG